MEKTINKSMAIFLTVLMTVMFIPSTAFAADEADDITYSVDADDELGFEEDDFNDECEVLMDKELNYVKFELPSSSKGILYYDYDGDDEEKVDDSDKYYYDDDDDDDELSISDVTFVPGDDYSGTVTISYKGYDVDKNSYTGDIRIKVSGVENDDADSANGIYYSAKTGSKVTFNGDDFNDECKDLLDDSLDYVKFKQPSSSYGTLYFDGDYVAKVSSSTKYYYSGTPYLNKVYFDPADDVARTVTIGYTGYDTDGSSFSGEIKITFSATSSSSSGSTSLYFGDLGGTYSWAVQYVDTLYATGIVAGDAASDGTKHYNPSYHITRGDFMLLLYRALNLQSSAASGNFSDVAAGSYYYDAVATAKALGIAEGTNNRFYPNATITREDAMVLTLRAMNKSGSGSVSGDISLLSSFNDKHMISDYAQEAIATLIKSGIITGGNDSQIHPKDNITRAEASAIIYRIKY